MSEQPAASAATVATPTTSGLTDEELSLVKCMNQREAIEYEIKIKKLIADAVKRFQWGQDPKEGDLALDMVYSTIVHKVKMLVKMVYCNITKANRKEIIKTVTNADGQCIWDSDIMEEDKEDDDSDDVQIQEEEGVPTPLDWVDMVQNLEVMLDAPQIDKIVMLLQCHLEMLEWQAMVLKMLAELGKSVDLVTFQLILQTVIWPMHQVHLPDSHLLVPKEVKKVKLSREVNIACWLTPDPKLMKDWAEDSATLYLAGTIYYWLEKVITKTSNMKHVTAKFRVHLTALQRCINGRIYKGGTAAQKQKTGTTSRDETPAKAPKKNMSKK